LVDTMREKKPGYSFESLLARAQYIVEFSSILGGVLGITFYLWGVPFIAYIIMIFLSFGCLIYCITSMEEVQNLVFYKWDGHLWKLMYQHTIRTIKISIEICTQSKLIQWFTIVRASQACFLVVVGRLWPVALGGQFGVSKWSWQWYTTVLLVPLSIGLTAKLLASKSHKQDEMVSASITRLNRWLYFAIYSSVFAVFILGIINSFGIINFPVFLLCVIITESSFGIAYPAYESLVSYSLPEKHAQERATVLSLASALKSFFVLLIIIPSRGSSDSLSTVGWLLPAGIVFIIGLIALYFIKKYQKIENENVKSS